MGINEFIQIGNVIKDLRIKKGLSQKEMAQKIGIPPTTYSNYENNHREPNIEILDKVANILEITTEDMLLQAIDKDNNLSQLDFILKTLKSMSSLMESEEITNKIKENINIIEKNIEQNNIIDLDEFMENLFDELSKYEN